MILEFVVELFESALSQAAIAFQQERTVGALGERFLSAIDVDERPEFHVDIGQLREGVVITMERSAAEGEQAFLTLAQDMRPHPANFVERNLPILQSWIGDELLPVSIVNRLNFRHNKSGSFRQFRH